MEEKARGGGRLMRKFVPGDTLIEVMFAVGVFGLVAVSAISLMNRGLNAAQASLETTMARQEIDTQAEALRFIHEAYVAEGEVKEDHPELTPYSYVWREIIGDSADPSSNGLVYTTEQLLQESPDFFDNFNGSEHSCAELYESLPKKSFIINPRLLDSNDLGTLIAGPTGLSDLIIKRNLAAEEDLNLHPAATYPRLLYGINQATIDSENLSDATNLGTYYNQNFYSAEGIYVTAVASKDGLDCTSEGDEFRPDFYDFYIRTCWDSPDGKTSSTVGSTVRLYNSDQINLNMNPVQEITFSNVEWVHTNNTSYSSSCGAEPAEHVIASEKSIEFHGYTAAAMNESISYTLETANGFDIEADIDTSTIKPHPGGNLDITLGIMTTRLGQNGGSILLNGTTIATVGGRFHLKMTMNGYEVYIDDVVVGVADDTSGNPVEVSFTFAHSGHCCSQLSHAYIRDIEMTQYLRHGDDPTTACGTSYKPTYNIAFDGNGATSGDMPLATFNSGENHPLPANTFSRSGYAFTNWNLAANGSNTSFEDGALVMDLAPAGRTVKLYAQWREAYYYIIFDPNGGNGSMTSMHPRRGANVRLTRNSFTRPNFHFVGWNTKADGTGTSFSDYEQVTDLADVDESVVLYAQWAPDTYFVQFRPNGGTPTSNSVQTIERGVPTVLDPNPYSRQNYTFLGWSPSSSASTPVYTDRATVTDLTTRDRTYILYAVWGRNTYTIEYNGNGATSGSMNPQTAYRGSAVALTNNYFSRENFHFVGWNTKADGTGTSFSNRQSVTDLAQTGETIRLYAQWERDTYQIVFRPNGGTPNANQIQTVGLGVATNLMANPFTRSGYRFTGWNTATNGRGTAFSDRQSVTNLTSRDRSYTLYAQWEEATECGSIPVMQNWNNGGSLAVQETTQLCDNRDYQHYTVAKLKDGKVWMVDNLALGNTANYPLVSNLTADNTNLSSTITISTFNSWIKTNSTAFSMNLFSDGEVYASLFHDPYSDSSYGAMYNYYAASAGTIRGTSNWSNAVYDICPAGWRLPTLEEFRTLYANYMDSDSSANGGRQLHKSIVTGGAAFARRCANTEFHDQGHCLSPSGEIGGVGAYWSSTALNIINETSGMVMGTLFMGNSDDRVEFSHHGRGYLQVLRCTLKTGEQSAPAGSYQIIFDKNDGSGTTSIQTVNVGATVNLNQNPFIRSGYTFTGWNTNNNGSGTSYTDGQQVTDLTTRDRSIVLYAQWYRESTQNPSCNEQGIPVMQNWNNDGSLNVGDSLRLCDLRDGTVYNVAKLQDGRVWMTDNLRLEFSILLENITALNTNNPSSAFISSANTRPQPATVSSRQNSQGVTYDYIDDFSISNVNSLVYSSVNIGGSNCPNGACDKYGVYYNWYAATAGNGVHNASEITPKDTNGDICPIGWHIPLGENNSIDTSNLPYGEYLYLAHTLNDLGLSPLNNPANFLRSGTISGTGQVSERGERGMYWASNHLGSINASTFLVSSVSMMGGFYKYNGMTVRCVLGEKYKADYNIIYKAGDAPSQPDRIQQARRDENVTLMRNPFVYSGYRFTGWKKLNDNISFSDGETVINLADAGDYVTLIAQWVPDNGTYQIIFDKNDGSGTTSVQTVSAGATTNLNPNPFSRTNYSFVNWNTKADGTGTSYADQESVYNLVARDRSIVLYAQWESNEPEVQTCADLSLPMMQNWINVNLTTSGDTTTLCDSRDLSEYPVAMLADGNVWMTKNLRLDFAQYGNRINASNTNNPTEAFLTSVNSNPAPQNTWCATITQYSACDLSLYYNDSNLGDNTTDSRGHTYDEYGVYYNWYAAMAGNNYNSTAGDLCPSGWRLPTGNPNATTIGEFDVLNNLMNAGSISSPAGLLASPANFVYSGSYPYNRPYRRGEEGVYWSSSRASDGVATLDISDSRVYPGTILATSGVGNSIRCILKAENNRPDRGTYQIIFDKNDGSETTSIQTVNVGVATSLNPNPFARSGYTFTGWNTNADGSGASYSDGQSVTDLTTRDRSFVLYAQWQLNIPEIGDDCRGTNFALGTMQNWNNTLANYADETYLCDVRDGNVYRVAKLADNKVWMTMDLRLDINSANITSSNTNNPTSDFLTSAPSSQPATSGSDLCMMPSQTCIDKIQYVRFWDTGYATGDTSSYSGMMNTIYYNWYTATAGNGVYDVSPGDSEEGDICPSGWHIPTTTEFLELKNAVSSKNNVSSSDPTEYAWLLRAPTYFGANGKLIQSNVGPDGIGLYSGNIYLASSITSLANGRSCNPACRDEIDKVRAWNNPFMMGYLMGYAGFALANKYDNVPVRCMLDQTSSTGTYTIWFKKNEISDEFGAGGGGPETEQVVNIGDSVLLNSNTFTRSNYRFTGWNTKADGTGTSYSDGQTVRNLRTRNGGRITLYAQWRSTSSW